MFSTMQLLSCIVHSFASERKLQVTTVNSVKVSKLHFNRNILGIKWPHLVFEHSCWQFLLQLPDTTAIFFYFTTIYQACLKRTIVLYCPLKPENTYFYSSIPIILPLAEFVLSLSCQLYLFPKLSCSIIVKLPQQNCTSQLIF